MVRWVHRTILPPPGGGSLLSLREFCSPPDRLFLVLPPTWEHVLLANVAIRAVRRTYPGADCVLAVPAGREALVQERGEGVSLVSYTSRDWMPWRKTHRWLEEEAAERPFCQAIDLSSTPDLLTASLIRSIRAPIRVGYTPSDWDHLYNVRVVGRAAGAAGRLQAILAAIGVEVREEPLTLQVNGQTGDPATRWRPLRGPKGRGAVGLMLRIDRRDDRELLRTLRLEERPPSLHGLSLVIIGWNVNSRWIQRWRDWGLPVLEPRGLEETLSVLARCRWVLTNRWEGGLMAAAVERPTVLVGERPLGWEAYPASLRSRISFVEPEEFIEQWGKREGEEIVHRASETSGGEF